MTGFHFELFVLGWYAIGIDSNDKTKAASVETIRNQLFSHGINSETLFQYGINSEPIGWERN